jgi:hypothetical protein
MSLFGGQKLELGNSPTTHFLYPILLFLSALLEMTENSFVHNKILIRLLVLSLIIIQIAFFISVYLTSALGGQLDFPKIFISHAIQQDPGRAIGAWLLPLTAFLIFWIIGSRLYRQHKFLPDYGGSPRASPPRMTVELVDVAQVSSPSRSRRRNLHQSQHSSIGRPIDEGRERVLQNRRAGWARILFWTIVFCLVVFCITMVGVSAVSIQTNRWLHWIIAGIMFIAGVLMTLFFPIVDYLSDLRFPKWLWIFRWVLAITGLILGILVAPLSSTVKLAGAIVEITLAVLFIIYTISFAHTGEFPLRSKFETLEEAEDRVRGGQPAIPPI